MGVAEGASGAPADAPGIGLEILSVSFLNRNKGRKKNLEQKKMTGIQCRKNKKV